MKQKLFLLVLTVFCLAGRDAWAQVFTQGAFTFMVTDANAKTVTVWKASKNITGDLVIPSQVSNDGVTYTVTSVFKDGFKDTHITGITIPASVESIGGGAFAYCQSLKRIVFEDSENEILVNPDANDLGTFERSNANKTVYIGRNLNDTGTNPFPNVTSVEFGEMVTSLPNYLFYNTTTLNVVKAPWQTPIDIDVSVFNNVTYQNALLSVPGGTVGKYKAHTVWQKFLNIQPTSYLVHATATAGGTLKFAGETVTAGTKSLYVDRETDVTFEVTSDENYDFNSLTINGSIVNVTNNTYTYENLRRDIEVKATFTEKPKFDINATATGGTVSLNGTTPTASQTINVYRDTDVTLAIQAYEGHYLSAVVINDEDVTNQIQNNTLILENIQEAKTIVVTFLKYTYTVSIRGAGISVSSTNPQYGDDVTVTIDDDPDRTLISLLINGQDVTDKVANGQYIIQNVTSNVTIEATFQSTKEFIAMPGDYATFSCPQDLDFTGSNLRAYIASGFNKNTNQVLLVRVYDVPAGTGVFLIGKLGETYKIPYAETMSIYMNFFQANLQESTIDATSGDFSNFTFGEQDDAPGFYPIVEEVTLQAQTAYLQLPTNFIAAGVKLGIAFEEDIIDGIENFRSCENEETIYDINGRKINSLPSGRSGGGHINIIRYSDGTSRKVLVK